MNLEKDKSPKSKKPKANRDKGVWAKDGKLYARIWVSEDGVKKPVTQRADDISHARRLVKELREKYQDRRIGVRGLTGEKMTFRELVAHVKENHYHEAQYDGDKELISGVRGLAETQSILTDLEKYFGSYRLSDITHTLIKRYRDARTLQKDDEGEFMRSKNRVNKYLTRLTAILSAAEREGWIVRNPFRTGASLKFKVDEVRRRNLTDDEEKRLLSVCDSERRRHMKGLIIAGIYTGVRLGELLNLKWADVDFENATFVASHYKGGRLVSYPALMNPIVQAELLALREVSKSLYVFQYVKAEGDKPLTTIKTSWMKICKDAKIENLQFRDLRKVSTTRLTERGIPAAIAAKVLGHTTTRMTEKHYIGTTAEMSRIMREALTAITVNHDEALTTEAVN